MVHKDHTGIKKMKISPTQPRAYVNKIDKPKQPYIQYIINNTQ